MLDKRTHYLLSRIIELSSDGSYKVVEEKDLLACFPLKLKTDGEGLVHMLNFLREHGYIDVRYAEEGIYCLSPLPEGRMYDERIRREREETLKRRAFLLVFTLLGAFAGAFAGAYLAAVIALSGGA